MSKKETLEMLDYIYKDLRCPICGAKAEAKLTGIGEGFIETQPCHTELEELIEQRTQKYFLLFGGEATSEKNGTRKYKFKS